MKSVWKSWKVVVGGGAAIILLWLGLPNVGKHLPRALEQILPKIYWVIALSTLFIAIFRAWSDEYRLRLGIQKRLIMESLQADIATKGIFPTSALAKYAGCSEEEVKPVLEELVCEKWLTKGGQAGTWVFVASSVFGRFSP
jgi:hypothetical protein